MRLSLEDFFKRIPKSKQKALNEALALQIEEYCRCHLDQRLSAGDRYESFFANVEKTTRVNRGRRNKDDRQTSPAERSLDRMKRMRAGEGGLQFAEATYFWFHSTEGLENAVKEIDEGVFGIPYAEWVATRPWFKVPDMAGEISSDVSYLHSASLVEGDARRKIEDLFQKMHDLRASFDTHEARGILYVEILNLFLSDHAERKFFYTLDYTDCYQSFTFEPDDFRFSSDENLLDGLLIKLSGIGRLLKLGIIERGDMAWLETILATVIRNPEVMEYLRWLTSEHQVPDHSDFRDALGLYAALLGEDDHYQIALEAYGVQS